MPRRTSRSRSRFARVNSRLMRDDVAQIKAWSEADGRPWQTLLREIVTLGVQARAGRVGGGRIL